MDIEETPVPLPSAPKVSLDTHITLQPPLSRRGHGPGLILLVPIGLEIVRTSHTLDPSPLQKWAEEGFAVVEIQFQSKQIDHQSLLQNVTKATAALTELQECDNKDSFGIVVYSSSQILQASRIIDDNKQIIVAVAYGGALTLTKTPQLVHSQGKSPLKSVQDSTTTYRYPEVASDLFVYPGHKDFISSSAAVAHTRCLTFMKPIMGGPTFDLEAIWDEHTYFEFGDRSMAKTMGTMVQEPYVNHVPTITGGIGRASLSNFYRYHFIWNNPDDTSLELISRTVGIDRIVDEFIFSLAHNKVVDWLLPGIPPTGKSLRIPFTSVVNIRGDRLYHEHIAWDQATVLIQLGILPQYLPYPYDLPGGQKPAAGKRFEYRVPAAGVETAQKLVSESSVPSNQMFEFAIREVDI